MEHFKVSDSTVTEIEKLVEEDIKKGNFIGNQEFRFNLRNIIFFDNLCIDKADYGNEG